MMYIETMGAIEIENAIKFLVHSIEEKGHNPKPVILHCIRVSNLLAFLGYKQDIVIGALLHDLHEDADISIDLIGEKFGPVIAHLVDANSFDSTISDKKQQYLAMYEKCIAGGKDALIIKAADLYDNSYYYRYAKHIESRQFLLEKFDYFVHSTMSLLGGEQIQGILLKRSEELHEFVFTDQ